MTPHDVLIAGAGPVGLFLTCELRLAGASVLVLEKADEPYSPLKRLPFGLRGLTMPSIELLERHGLLDALAPPWRVRELLRAGRFSRAVRAAILQVSSSTSTRSTAQLGRNPRRACQVRRSPSSWSVSSLRSAPTPRLWARRSGEASPSKTSSSGGRRDRPRRRRVTRLLGWSAATAAAAPSAAPLASRSPVPSPSSPATRSRWSWRTRPCCASAAITGLRVCTRSHRRA